jgi:hypothetical protein
MTTATKAMFDQLTTARAEAAAAKSDFKSAVCNYFESQGAPRAKLAEILKGVAAVGEYRQLADDWVPSMFGPELGPDPIASFSPQHHQAIEKMLPLYAAMILAQAALTDAELDVDAYSQSVNRGR